MNRINTGRQTIAAKQRNCNYRPDGKPSKSTHALMVRIDWTDAKVVKMTARQRFTLNASTVSVIHGQYEVIAQSPMPVPDGMTLHFVASDGFPGWYYVCIKQHDGSFGCTCPKAAQFHQHCHHQQDAASFEARRRMEEDVRQHNALAAPVEYRVYEDEFGQFIPQFRNAHGWFSFARPGWLALGYTFRSQEEASAFLDEQRGLEAAAA